MKTSFLLVVLALFAVAKEEDKAQEKLGVIHLPHIDLGTTVHQHFTIEKRNRLYDQNYGHNYGYQYGYLGMSKDDKPGGRDHAQSDLLKRSGGDHYGYPGSLKDSGSEPGGYHSVDKPSGYPWLSKGDKPEGYHYDVPKVMNLSHVEHPLMTQAKFGQSSFVVEKQPVYLAGIVSDYQVYGGKFGYDHKPVEMKSDGAFDGYRYAGGYTTSVYGQNGGRGVTQSGGYDIGYGTGQSGESAMGQGAGPDVGYAIGQGVGLSVGHGTGQPGGSAIGYGIGQTEGHGVVQSGRSAIEQDVGQNGNYGIGVGVVQSEGSGGQGVVQGVEHSMEQDVGHGDVHTLVYAAGYGGIHSTAGHTFDATGRGVEHGIEHVLGHSPEVNTKHLRINPSITHHVSGNYASNYDYYHYKPEIDLGTHVHRHVTIVQRIGIPVLRPYPVKIEKKIPVPVVHKIPVYIDKPYAVHVVRPYPVFVEKPVPYHIVRHVPVLAHFIDSIRFEKFPYFGNDWKYLL